jgi:ribosomal-protein-alanine N-acetyltransferase
VIFQIDSLGAGHLEAMSGVHHACFASGWSVDALDKLMVAPHTLGLGHVLPGGALAGFILCSAVIDEAEILTLAVAPECRRHGLARALLEKALVVSAARGAKSLVLEVSQTNSPARGLYEASGFVETGRRPGYYTSQGGADALILRLEFGPRV